MIRAEQLDFTAFIQLLRKAQPHLSKEHRPGRLFTVRAPVADLSSDSHSEETELGFINLETVPQLQAASELIWGLGLVPVMVHIGQDGLLCSVHPTEPLTSIHHVGNRTTRCEAAAVQMRVETLIVTQAATPAEAGVQS